MAELIDIYDDNRQPTGERVERKGAFLGEGQYMLYVLAILEDLDGRVLITRRTLDKKWAAGWWEVTGGGVSAGETSAQAIAREVREEVGLSVDDLVKKPIHGYKNIDLPRGDNYFVDIYHLRFDFSLADVSLQAREAIDARLVTWGEIAQLDQQGIFLHYRRLQDALAAEREAARA